MWLLRIVAFSYYSPLHYYTIDPIHDIANSQADVSRLRKLLHDFKVKKEEETQFVRVASTLSAAATIGVFSWDAIQHSFWLATTCFHCSLFLSIFALISSAQTRLLAFLPTSGSSGHRECQLRDLLPLVLYFPPKAPGVKASSGTGTPNSSRDPEQIGSTSAPMGVPSRRRMFFWQNSMMLMSWSWVAFLTGLALHVVTPLIRHKSWTIESVSALMVILFGIIVFADFSICNFDANKLTDELKGKRLWELTESSSITS